MFRAVLCCEDRLSKNPVSCQSRLQFEPVPEKPPSCVLLNAKELVLGCQFVLRTCPCQALRQRDHIASHWSTTHTQWWSVLRYLVHPTTKKPEVDKHPFVWAYDKRELDLYHESQEPYQENAWKRRREEHERSVSAGLEQKPKKFTKLDLTSVVLAKGLSTKNLLMEFTQDFGSKGMQLFVHQNQPKLKELLEDAKEWGNMGHPCGCVSVVRGTSWAGNQFPYVARRV